MAAFRKVYFCRIDLLIKNGMKWIHMDPFDKFRLISVWFAEISFNKIFSTPIHTNAYSTYHLKFDRYLAGDLAWFSQGDVHCTRTCQVMRIKVHICSKHNNFHLKIYTCLKGNERVFSGNKRNELDTTVRICLHVNKRCWFRL